MRSLKIGGEERGWGVNNYNSNRIDIKYGVSQNDSMTGLDNKRRRWRWNAIFEQIDRGVCPLAYYHLELEKGTK